MSKKRNYRNLKNALLSVSAACLISIGVISTYAGYNTSGSSQITAAAGTLSISTTTGYSYNGDSFVNPTAWVSAKVNTDVSHTITVKNTGTVPVKYSLTPHPDRTADSKLFSPFWNATIKDGDTVHYNGPLSTISTASLSIPANTTKNITVALKPVSSAALRSYLTTNGTKYSYFKLSVDYST